MGFIRTGVFTVLLTVVLVWTYLRGLDTGYNRGQIEGERQALASVDGFNAQTILSQTS